MSYALETFFDTPEKELTAPDRAIVSIAGTVKTDAENALIPFLALREHGSYVSAVMLNLASLRAVNSLSVRGRNILRMAIMNDEKIFRIHVVHRNQIVNRLLTRPEGLIVAKITDVLADERLAANDQSDRVLQISAQCQNWPRSRQLRHRAGSITARPPQNSWAKGASADHRIIDTASNRPLADEERSAMPAKRSRASESS